MPPYRKPLHTPAPLLIAIISLVMLSACDDHNNATAPAPAVPQITSPADGSSVKAPFTIEVSIPEPEASQTQWVHFFDGGHNLLDSVTAPPWTWTVGTAAYSDSLVHVFSVQIGLDDGTAEGKILYPEPISIRVLPADADLPRLLYPAPGQTLDTYGSTVLRWSSVAGAKGYEYEVAADSLFTTLVTRTTTQDTMVAWHPPERRWYFWRVRRHDPDGTLGPRGSYHTFHSGVVFSTLLTMGMDSQGSDMLVTGDGDIIVCGQSHLQTNGPGRTHGVVTGFSDEGALQWKTELPEDQFSILNGMTPSGYTGVACVGTANYENNDQHIMLTQFDLEGNLGWRRDYPLPEGINYSRGEGCAALIGGFILAGYQSGSNHDISNYDALLMKVDDIGDVVWSRTYGGSRPERLLDVAAVGTGFVAVGSTRSFSRASFTTDGWVLRCDAAGDTLWTGRVGRGHFCELFSVTTLDGGGVAATGIDTDFLDDVVVARFDASGNLMWERYYGGFMDGGFDGRDGGQGIAATADGGFLVTGYGYGFPNPTDLLVMKLDPDGTVLWQNHIGPEGCWGNAIRPTSDGGALIAARHDRPEGLWLLRCDAHGATLDDYGD